MSRRSVLAGILGGTVSALVAGCQLQPGPRPGVPVDPPGGAAPSQPPVRVGARSPAVATVRVGRATIDHLLRHLDLELAAFEPVEARYFAHLRELLVRQGVLGAADRLDRYTFDDPIARFQRARGLSESGLPDEATLWALAVDWAAERRLEVVRVEADRWAGRVGADGLELREDVATRYRQLRLALRLFGAVLTADGGFRELSAAASGEGEPPGLHQAGLAFDLAPTAGMQSADDPYIVEQDGAGWRVWARADRGGERKLAGVMWRQGGPVVEEVRARVVDFTALARWFGFQPVGVAGGFPRRYGLANWWHFQCEDALVPLASQLGTELLSLRRYAEDDLRAAGVWDRRTDRLVLDRDRASWRFGAAGPAIAPELSARYYRVVADEIRRALAEYQAIPIALPARDPLGAPAPTPAPSSAEVGVRAPYWINARADAAARAAEVEAAPPELRRVFKAAPVAARLGKGTPDEIRATVQAAVATGQVRARGGVWPPTAADVERWMATFGLGIDCSGFVYETLRRVERALAPRALDGLAVPAIGPSHLFGSGRAAEGYPVTRPSDLNVGDLMHLPPWPKDPIGHVRIVDSVALEGGALVFTTAEATAAGTGGATAVRWRFPDAATMARLERHADGRWRSANEREQRTAGFYRHLPLMRAGLSTIA